MVTTHKESPGKGMTTQTGGDNLPYPVTPVSPRQDFGDFRTDHETVNHPVNPPHYLNPIPASQSNISLPSVSELSEGWVDGDIGANEDNSQSKVSVLSATDSGSQQLPATLKVGAPGLTPKSSSESQLRASHTPPKPTSEIPPSLRVLTPQGGRSTNPFHRSQSSEGHPSSNEASKQPQTNSDIWQQMLSNPPPPTQAPPDPPVEAQESQEPIPEIQNHSVQSGGTGAFMGGAVSSKPEHTAPPGDTIASSNPFADSYRQEIQQSPWASNTVAGSIDQDPFSGLDSLEKPQAPSTQTEEEAPKFSVTNNDFESNMIPANASQPSSFNAPQVFKEQQNTQEPEQPLRVQIPSQQPSTRPDTETPSTRARRQRSETYEVKHIRWQDSTSTEIRTTPIMIQNANGPCPLLALVNALTLSTPANLNTPLVETLRVRENVTLGLLLDAVFDELMSGRRGSTAQELPDVGDLYTFLINLHTGLNVNPRFTPFGTQSATLIDGFEPTSPISHDSRRAGGFEDTKEMKMYATFAIPLIHGWLPPRTHPAFAALHRSANTYEDAQNLLFREEELEDKLQHSGLSQEDQQLLEDIASVKYFLSSSATQLTGYGLDTITDTLFPGSIAILFRNDHFSTLYKHPRSGQILTLVTDAGYAGHAEVVWESLVDVSGEGSEFYSGDFRPVGQSSSTAQPSSYSNQDSGWTTVQSRSNRNRSSTQPPVQPPRPSQAPPSLEDFDLPSSPRNTEQEDADLALALQLQEEEEENNRRAAETRRREEEQASHAYISSQNLSTAPNNAGPRNSSRRTSQPGTGRRLASASAANNSHPSRTSLVSAASYSNSNPNSTHSHISLSDRDRDRPLASASAANASRPDRDRPLPLPPRPGGNRPHDPEAGEDAPPPTYEQASKTQPYHPPEQPMGASASSNTNQSRRTSVGMGSGVGAGQTAYAAHRASVGSRGGGPSVHRRTSAGMGGLDEGMMGGVARRRSGTVGQGVGQGQGHTAGMEGGKKERDCVVM